MNRSFKRVALLVILSCAMCQTCIGGYDVSIISYDRERGITEISSWEGWAFTPNDWFLGFYNETGKEIVPDYKISVNNTFHNCIRNGNNYYQDTLTPTQRDSIRYIYLERPVQGGKELIAQKEI